MEILNTTNYSQFERIVGNRVINKGKIKRIKKEIEGGLNLLPYCPVIVYPKGDNLLIVDGQHRYTVSEELDLPVYYVICHELTLQQIASLNNNSDKWIGKDFLNCYVNLGLEDYKKLQFYCNEHSLSISLAASLLMSGRSNCDTAKKAFKEGTFKVNEEEFTQNILSKIDLFNRYNFYRDPRLAEAVIQLDKKGLCDWEVLAEKIDMNPMGMDKQGSSKKYIYNIEQVYNYHNSKRQIIF